MQAKCMTMLSRCQETGAVTIERGAAMYCAHCGFDLGERPSVCRQCNGRKFRTTPLPEEAVIEPSDVDLANHTNPLRRPTGIAWLMIAALVIMTAWAIVHLRYIATVSAAHDEGWDRVSISAWLMEKTVFGQGLPVPARVVSVTLRDSSGNALYSGSSTSPELVDAKLGSKEPVSVEVCLTPESGGASVCQGDTILASSKKSTLADVTELAWPLSSASILRGEYRLGLVRQREKYAQPGVWEEIGNDLGRLRIEAKVEGATGPSTVVLEALADGSKQGFSLDKGVGFAGFQAAIEQSLAMGGDANVSFSIVEDDSGRSTVLKQMRRTFHRKTQAEREMEVARCVQGIAQVVVGTGYRGGNAVSGHTRGDWRFDTQQGRYFVDMDILWRGSLSNMPYSIAGRAEFSEEGRAANFYLSGEDAGVKVLRLFSGIQGLHGSEVGTVSCGR